MKLSIFISTTTFAKYNKKPLDILKENKINYEFNTYNRKLTEDEIRSILQKNSYYGLVAGTEPLTTRVLTGSEPLKIISRVGKGLDNINLKTAENLNLKIYNTSEGLADAVAELTMGLIFSSLRKITAMDRKMRNKIWKKEMGALFKGKILGIIGFGDIGKKVAQLASSFATEIICYDIKEISSQKFKQVSMNELLKKSDILSLHSSSKEKLITEKQIKKMKPGAVIINTSRGSIIDEDDLYRALSSGKIGAAALDVHKEEPYSGKLFELDNVTLTPHVGSYAKEARIKMEIKAVENLIEGLKEIGLL